MPPAVQVDSSFISNRLASLSQFSSVQFNLVCRVQVEVGLIIIFFRVCLFFLSNCCLFRLVTVNLFFFFFPPPSSHWEEIQTVDYPSWLGERLHLSLSLSRRWYLLMMMPYVSSSFLLKKKKTGGGNNIKSVSHGVWKKNRHHNNLTAQFTSHKWTTLITHLWLSMLLLLWLWIIIITVLLPACKPLSKWWWWWLGAIKEHGKRHQQGVCSFSSRRCNVAQVFKMRLSRSLFPQGGAHCLVFPFFLLFSISLKRRRWRFNL